MIGAWGDELLKHGGRFLVPASFDLAICVATLARVAKEAPLEANLRIRFDKDLCIKKFSESGVLKREQSFYYENGRWVEGVGVFYALIVRVAIARGLDGSAVL